jgi:hypothetical protein
MKSIVALYVLLLAPLAAFTGNAYAQSLAEDAAAFRDGTAPKFSTKGHPKSKGAVFTIRYPPSWEAKEGDRPNIVQKFTTRFDGGGVAALILTRSVPPGEPFTKADVRAALSHEGLREFLPDNTLLYNLKSTKIEGEPAGLIELTMVEERAGITASLQTMMLVFFQGRTMVCVQFHVTAPSPAPDLPKRFEEFRPLFNMMMNSIVFDDKWK